MHQFGVQLKKLVSNHFVPEMTATRFESISSFYDATVYAKK